MSLASFMLIQLRHGGNTRYHINGGPMRFS